MISVRIKFDTLQETFERRQILNDEYENFVTAHIEVSAKCLPNQEPNIEFYGNQ